MLEAKNIYRKYGNLEVLKNVSIKIAPKEFISIVGPSGAGKSTLLHILSSLDTPDSGNVFVEGQDILQLNNKQQAKFRNNNFGFVFQFHHLLPEFTALENVCIPLWISGKDNKEATVQAQKILQTIGLEHRLQHKPNELSGGEQQRVAIARALVHRPKYLFADEPTGNLDSANATAIHELFKTIHNSYDITIIIVTHNEQLAGMANKTYEMIDGNITRITHNSVLGV
jgi:lipoprotein-releasing system ATP-binding protein